MNIGQRIRFKENTWGYKLYGDITWEILGHPTFADDTDDEDPDMVIILSTNGKETTASLSEVNKV